MLLPPWLVLGSFARGRSGREYASNPLSLLLRQGEVSIAHSRGQATDRSYAAGRQQLPASRASSRCRT
jgi:hypothetical protein